MSQVHELSDDDIAALFGCTVARLRAASGPLLSALDRRYGVIAGADRDALLLAILKRIDGTDLPEAGPHRADDWERGWQENLDDFVASGHDPRTLVPKYYKAGVPVRLNGDWVRPRQPDFVYRFTDLFRNWLFQEYLAGASTIYEFGCGTGYNLTQLAAIHPGTPLVGLDWAHSSQRLLGAIADHLRLPITGRHFDFFSPDPSIRPPEGWAALTFGALEQVGARHDAYLDFIISRRPVVCVDVIGVAELYDEAGLADYLAARYHRRRGYLAGYLTRLRELEAASRIRIVKTHHQRFGTLYDDPHSYIVWTCS